MSPNTTRLRSENVFTLLEKVAPTLEDICIDYDWAFSKSAKKCTASNDFGKIVTEDGMCYTFNMLDKSELFQNGT